jgi:hypothetical protein
VWSFVGRKSLSDDCFSRLGEVSDNDDVDGWQKETELGAGMFSKWVTGTRRIVTVSNDRLVWECASLLEYFISTVSRMEKDGFFMFHFLSGSLLVALEDLGISHST